MRMTENEAIDKLNNLHYKILHSSFSSMVYVSEIEALCMAKDCLKEIQQYRAIGTVEEFKDLKEKALETLLKDGQLLYQQGLIDGYDKAVQKNIAKKPIERKRNYLTVFDCPTCNAELYSGQRFCDECGQPMLDDYE